MCAPLALAGAVRVSSASARPSQAQRSTGDSVEISRVAAFSGEANSGSITSSRLSPVAGSVAVGSRTAQIRPSPEDRPVAMRAGSVGSARAIRRRTWSQEEPLRALAVSPTSTRNSLG